MFSHCYIIAILFCHCHVFYFALLPSSLHSVPQEKKVPGDGEYLLMPVL